MAHRSRLWPYLLSGAVLGAAFELLVSLPLDAVFRALFEYLYAGNPFRLEHALDHLARPGEWPAVSLTGLLLGTILGAVFYRLKENQRRLQSLRQEFESQVAALRHHYKNLALGISGFSSRARRKLENLRQRLQACRLADADVKAELEALEKSVLILEDASSRLASTLADELMFLKALQSDGPAMAARDLYPVLRHAVQELRDLRFRDKAIAVEINGRPFQEPCAPLVFPFEPYAMEVILQNLLSNAMRYGDLIQVWTAERNAMVSVEIIDNGPGVKIQDLKRSLVGAGERRGAESTQLGLRVTLHLLDKCGGRLYAANNPGGGAAFILEFPRQPAGAGRALPPPG